MSPGTLTEGDGISTVSQLSLNDKHVTIECDVTAGACVWKGAAGKGVVYIKDNFGTTTLSQIIVRNGDRNGNGGGLAVWNSVVLLDRVSFIENAAGTNGGAVYVFAQGTSTVTMEGCSFSGNTATSEDGGSDVHVAGGETASITGCPEGERANMSRGGPARREQATMHSIFFFFFFKKFFFFLN